jgi:lysophospholipase L1-like esterase
MHRHITLPSLLTLVLVSAPLTGAEPPAEFFFHKGDRIVFLGDSITQQYRYTSTVELYLTTRFPKWDMTFLNAGISSDTATGGANRFADHVLVEEPSAITINFGMNDAFGPHLAQIYIKSTESMILAAKKAGARVAVLSPNAVDVRAQPKLKAQLQAQEKFYAPLRELARKHNVPFVDQYAVTRKAMEMIAADDSPVHPFPDGIHTDGTGGLLMAHAILVSLNAPAVVSDLSIDAPSKKATTTDCEIEQMKITPSRITFWRTDRALPMPIRPDWRPILPYVNQLRDLNYYGLKVTGLPAGEYALSIDSKKVGEFTAAELSQGVNLGNLPTGGLFDHGEEVLKMIEAKNRMVINRFFEVVVYRSPDWLADVAKERKPAEMKKRLAKIQAMQAEIYKKARPVAHRFELRSLK